jgi:hypothetical protein
MYPNPNNPNQQSYPTYTNAPSLSPTTTTSSLSPSSNPPYPAQQGQQNPGYYYPQPQPPPQYPQAFTAHPQQQPPPQQAQQQQQMMFQHYQPPGQAAATPPSRSTGRYPITAPFQIPSMPQSWPYPAPPQQQPGFTGPIDPRLLGQGASNNHGGSGRGNAAQGSNKGGYSGA